MLLSGKEIKDAGLLKRAKDGNYTSASYYLTVGKIVSMDGKIHDEYKIPPRGMVVLISEEIFNLPDNIIGYTTVKNSLSCDGLLAINVGLVDPEWRQPISSTLINFGSQNKLVIKGDKFLRMTFQKFEKFDINELSQKKEAEENVEQIRKCKIHNLKSFLGLKNCTNCNWVIQQSDNNAAEKKIFDNYLNERRKESLKALSETFLSINQIKNEIANKVWKKFTIGITILATITCVLGFIIPNIKSYYNSLRVGVIKENELKLDSINKKVERLETIINLNRTNEYRNSLEKNGTRGMESKGK